MQAGEHFCYTELPRHSFRNHKDHILINVHLIFEKQIRGFPTIKIFQKGESPLDYDGGRTRSDIVSRALDLFSDNAPPPELLEVNHLGHSK